MSKPKYEWFLEPQDAQSNQVIAQEISEENFYTAVLCKDGERRGLWLVPYCLAEFFWKSRNSGIDIKVFCRTVNTGTSRGRAKDMTFLFRKKSLKIKKQKAS